MWFIIRKVIDRNRFRDDRDIGLVNKEFKIFIL